MAKRLDDTTMLDLPLNVIKNSGTQLIFCSADPVNYAGIAAVTLITATGLTASSYTGPTDDTSGRKLTVNAITGMTPSATGSVTYACIVGSPTLFAGTTVTAQVVNGSQTWNSPAFKINYQDPT